MNKFSLALALSAALLVAAPVAMATEVTQTPQEIVSFQRDLRSKLDMPTGDYKRFSQEQLETMKHAQDRVFSMLDGVTSLDQLNQNQRIELSNALDQIKSTLLAKEDNRLVCHLERKIGSNLMERRCETVASRRQRQQEAEMMLTHDGISR